MSAPYRYQVLNKYIELLRNHQGRVYLIQLTCPREMLFERIDNQDRLDSQKIADRELLEVTLDKFGELFSSIAGEESLTIDTGNNSVNEIGEQIISYIQQK